MRTIHQLAFAAMLLLLPGRTEARFRAGAHIVDISPTNYPVIVNAMFTERSASKVVDRLYVRALALDDGSNHIVIAVVDTCMMPRDLIDRAKEMARDVVGLDVSKMLVAATHTHSAPSAMGCLGSRADTNYAVFLAPQIAEAIAGAVRSLTPAQVGWGSVDDWEHTHCRRWIRRPDRMLTDPFGERTVRANMHPGHESPDVVGPAGPADPELSVLALRRLDGAPIAVLANYSQHYYGSPLLSSDYFGRFASHLAGLMNVPGGGTNGFIPMMSQGTSGDLMWMDYSAPAKDVGYDAYAMAMAEKVAGVLRRMNYKDWVPLGMAERALKLTYRTPDQARLEWARKTAESIGDRLPRTQPEIYALEAVHLHRQMQTELTIQALRIGDVGIAALPNEVYAITGLKLKEQSPLPATFTMELANGAEGYIPPPEQHKLGGYTTWPARTAGLETNAEPRIVETALALLEEVSGKPRVAHADEHGEYAKAVLRAEPVAYWRFNEHTIPTALDATSNRQHAQYENGIALYLPGVDRRTGFQPPEPQTPNHYSGSAINRAPHFAGGRVHARPALPRQRYSVELWIWNGLPNDSRPVTGYFWSRGKDGDPQAAGDHLGIAGTLPPGAGGKLIVFNGNSASNILAGSTVLAWREWQHVVFVRDGAMVTVYLNGNTTPELSGEMPLTLDSQATSIFIGGRCDNFANFEGKIDEVAVYGRVLKPEEISTRFKVSRMSN